MPGPCHDLDDAGVGRFQAPRPEIRAGGAVAEAMHQIEGIEERGRDGHGAVEAGAAFLLLSKVRTAAWKSTRSAVSARASEGRQPVYSNVQQ